MSDIKFEPCPACGSKARYSPGYTYICCTNPDCEVTGPVRDRDGAKWNALPRKKVKQYSKKDVKQLVKLTFVLRDWIDRGVTFDDFCRKYPDLGLDTSVISGSKCLLKEIDKILAPFLKAQP